MTKKIKRVLLKISWEALSWDTNNLFDVKVLDQLSKICASLLNNWVEVWIVIWWWNIFRWVDWKEFWVDRVTLDYMWMISTYMNWLMLRDYFNQNWVKSKLLTSTKIDCIWERYDKKIALNHLKEKTIVIFAWWTWNPYFTTDTWWVLRALEIEADLMIKATKVDWVYDKDPKKHDNAKKYDSISYDEVLEKWLKVMDAAAIALARDNDLLLVVTNLFKKDSIIDIVLWKSEWTKVSK